MESKGLVITRVFDALPGVRRGMVGKALVPLAGVGAAFVVVVALQPVDFHIARSAHIAAVPADVFAHVNDPQKMRSAKA